MLKYETIIIIAIQRPLWVLLSIFVLHLVFLLLLVQFVFLLQRFTHTSLSLSLSLSLVHWDIYIVCPVIFYLMLLSFVV